MTALDLLSQLRRRSIKVWADGDKLRFSAAPGALTAELRAELVKRKPEILALLRPVSAGPAPIVPAQRGPDHHLPLSFAQQRLWFLDQLQPGSPAYNMSPAFRLAGRLDRVALERSLDEVVRRHEVLRTIFAAVDGRPVQIITPESVHVPMTVVDLCDPSAGSTETLGAAEEEAVRESQARILVQAEVHRPFDLRRGPLLRALLLRLGEDEHVLALVVHHIASDGWSNGILWRELTTLYQAYASGEPSPLAELPIQYADYALRQREWLRGEVLDEHLAYWKRQLSAGPVTELPADRPRPAVASYAGARHPFNLPLDVTERLEALSRNEGTTLFMTLLAAYQMLLSRYTGQDDIIVGSPIANRTRAETEGLIGFFVNTLVLRTDLAGDPTFRELLGRVREVCLGAYAHQDLPFEKLVEELHPKRDLSRNPLLQITFALQNAPTQPLELAGLGVTPFRFQRTIIRFDLETHLWPTPGGISGSLLYNIDLYESTTIARLAGHFRTLLEGVAENPDQRLSDVPLLTLAERRQLVVWNQKESPFPEHACIHHLFERWVDRTPAETAVVCDGRHLSYQELNARANQLAHYLRRQGVGPEVTVAVCAERSLETVVALMGILKAGGAYVPLDPAYPDERLMFMCRDAGVRLLLTQSAFRQRFSTLSIAVLCLDTDGEWPADECRENPDSWASADNLAYIIYTSGSTGLPKGVMITHRNVVGFLHSYKQVTQDGPRRVGVWAASISFDVSAEELFSTLCFGGTVHLIQPEISTNVEAFARYLVDHQVTTVYILPFFLSGVASHLQSLRDRLSLRCVITGLQPKTERVLQDMRDVLPDGRILNAYGPTEVTYGATAFEFGATHAPDQDAPIGVPFPNYRTYIVDRNLNPVPVGVVGELLIGGVGLAWGYFDRPGLTAEKFVPNPFASPQGTPFRDQAGSRLYRTGDLVRYRPDGNIEFLGRADSQVKIRGFRVELGEVEAVLGQHPAVKDAVVVAREGATSAERVLVGYIVPAGEEEPAARELRGFLKQKLPEYMVPAAYVTLDALPLMPSGKVDRRALSEAELARPDLEQAYVAPCTPVEARLVEIWAAVLRLGPGKVGVHDDFFELGGHSLLGTQVIARIRSAFQVELPLRSLFESPTIAGLAAQIDQLSLSGQPAIRPVLREGMEGLPLSFSQQRLWFLDQLEPGTSAYKLANAYRLTGLLDREALEWSINQIVQRHESLRTTFAAVDGEPVQVIAPALTIPLEYVDLRELAPAEREGEARRLVEQSRRPFDLSRGPLLRAVLLRLDEEEHILSLVIHHIVSDGWSQGVLRRELMVLYQGCVGGQRGQGLLPELPIQYADYAVWQREWLQGSVLEEQLGYWKKQLAGAPAVELPADRARPPVQSHRGEVQSQELSPELTERLQALNRREGVTPFMTLLAGFKLLLARHTGLEDVVVGTPIAGRNRQEIEGLIGFFLNSLALRTDLSGDGGDERYGRGRPAPAAPTFSELLGRVREVCLGAYAHQEIPFEKLLEELQPERDLSRTPLFQVFFNMLNLEGSRLELPGLRVERYPLGGVDARFDLEIYAWEREGGIHLRWVYNADLYQRERMTEMMAQYRYLLEQVAADPGRRVWDYSLVTPAAAVLPNPRESLSAEWMGSVQSRLARHAQRAPDRLAVVDEHERWTYGELEQRSNQLANCLITGGIRPGEVVAIYGHRSAALVWAILGTLKAGAAFLVLDPAYPPARLVDYLERSQPRGWIEIERADAPPEAVEKCLASLPLYCRLGLPGAENLLAGYPSGDPGVEVGPDDLACVVFTSGSTGVPKAVLGRHGSLTHFQAWRQELCGLTPADRFGMLSGLAYSPLQRDIFTPWWVGATIYIPDQEKMGSPGWLAGWMAEQGITFVTITPAMGQLLTETAPAGLELLSLRNVFLLGDKLTRRDVARLRQLAPRVTCINSYGTTETQRAEGFYVVPFEGGADSGKTVYPAGRGMPDVQLLVLTGRGGTAGGPPLLAGVGELGEIYVRSPHLGLGYLGDEELTRRRFVTNPFTGEPGDRLYRTGDLGRYRPDGNVELVGRADRQIKVRGYRIEPAEVEEALVAHPWVREAHVMGREDAPGGWGLVAYIVPTERRGVVPAGSGGATGEEAPGAEEMRAFLLGRLPGHMVPAGYVVLPQGLPLTPNGKVDVRALPAPDRLLEGEGQAGRTAPRNETEERIAAIWAGVLRLDAGGVGVHDSFFDLGGHSLLATQIVARIRSALQVELPLRALFEGPTVAALAERVAQIPQLAARLLQPSQAGGEREGMVL